MIEEFGIIELIFELIKNGLISSQKKLFYDTRAILKGIIMVNQLPEQYYTQIYELFCEILEN